MIGRRTGILFLTLSLIAALALVFACGGDGESDGDGGERSPGATAEPSGDGDGNGEDGGNLSDELHKLGTDWGNVSGRITYEMTDPASGTSTFTLYQDPPGKSRMDITGDQGDVIVITTTEASYFCTSSEGTGLCFKSPAEQGTVPTFFSDFSDPGSFDDLSAGGLNVDAFDDEIAGVDANCFSANGSGLYQGQDGKATWCFSKSGLLLLSSFEGDSGSFSMKATDVGDISADDFEPPFEVTDIGG